MASDAGKIPFHRGTFERAVGDPKHHNVEEAAWERERAVAELGAQARLFRERAEGLDHERKQLVDRSESLAVRLAMLEAELARSDGQGQHS